MGVYSDIYDFWVNFPIFVKISPAAGYSMCTCGRFCVPDFDFFACHSVPFFSNLMNFNSETGFRLLSLRYVLERERKNSRKMKELRNADRISSGDCVSV